jgi:aspartyl-tRNA(Asn)/glutamyl-tRNA(Gln) amidotransferase subunit B
LVLSDAWRADERKALPELPVARRERFERQFRLAAAESAVVTATPAIADYFESFAARLGKDAGKEAWNWVANDLLSLSSDGETIPLAADRAAEVVGLVRSGKVSRQAAKRVLPELVAASDVTALAVAERLGLVQVSDTGAVDGWVRETLAAHPGEVVRYRGGETKLMGFLVGQVMKRSAGKADPKAVNAALAAALAKAPG